MSSETQMLLSNSSNEVDCLPIMEAKSKDLDSWNSWLFLCLFCREFHEFWDFSGLFGERSY